MESVTISFNKGDTCALVISPVYGSGANFVAITTNDTAGALAAAKALNAILPEHPVNGRDRYAKAHVFSFARDLDSRAAAGLDLGWVNS